MSDSLIPERPLLVSPSLASAIGLESALLLQHLEHLIELTGTTQPNSGIESSAQLDQRYRWNQCSLNQLNRQLPFWEPAAIRRILQNLIDLGMLLVSEHPLNANQLFHIAINQAQHTAPHKVSAPTATPLGAQKILPNWQPNAATRQKLAELGIDNHFAQKSVGEFVIYWRERNETSHAWSSKFLQYVSRSWEQEQQRRAATTRRTSGKAELQRSWEPSADAVEILQQMGIHQNFIVDAIPEFILYWRERGGEQKTWNSKFVSHVKRQWASYTHTLKHDTEPRPIEESWQPDGEVFDILTLANIDAEFAQSLIPEFVMYWRDRNELHHSWNTRFLQFAKRQWSNNFYKQENTGSGNNRQSPAARKTRDRSLVEDLTDRSWAG